MKRNYIANILIILFLAFGLASCENKQTKETGAHVHAKEYTCPMHPQVVQKEPGTCPICGMDLVEKTSSDAHGAVDTSLHYLLKPVNEQVVAAIPTVSPEYGTQIYTAKVEGRITYDTRNQTSIASRVSGRIERLYIKYNYQPVKKGQLIMEIYSPDLAAAQRELLFISRSGNTENMLQAAKQRLLLLGMTSRQISQILKTEKITYRVPVYSNASGYILEKSASPSAPTPAPSSTVNTGSAGGGMDNMGAGGSTTSATSYPATGSSPVLIREGQYLNAGQTIFTVYRTGGLTAEFSLNPQIAARVDRNAKILIQRTANKEESVTGKIGLIQPVFSEGENFTVARIYLNNTKLQPGELVAGLLPMVSDKSRWLPKEAVLSLGNRSVVFKKEGSVFIPKEVTTGITADKKIEITSDIADWQVAQNAYYMVDSESFIKIQNGKEL